MYYIYPFIMFNFEITDSYRVFLKMNVKICFGLSVSSILLSKYLNIFKVLGNLKIFSTAILYRLIIKR